MAKKDNTTSIGFEDAIWRAADKLRGNLNASEYEGVVLGLIFLKYISDKFEAKYQELLQEPDADVEGGQTDASGYEGIFKQMREEFGFKYVVSTLRESFSATFNGWKALIYDGKEFYQSKRYEINPIIDRVGGGDSFSGGLIHGLLTKATQGEALEFAVAASALKHTINGDFNLVSVDEVESLAGGNANGRVQR